MKQNGVTPEKLEELLNNSESVEMQVIDGKTYLRNKDYNNFKSVSRSFFSINLLNLYTIFSISYNMCFN